MKTKRTLLFAAIISLILLFARHARPADPAPSPATSTAAAQSPARKVTKLFYKAPPDANRFPVRVRGGARGGSNDGTSLLALVPDDVALTTQAQPSLFGFNQNRAKAEPRTHPVCLSEPKLRRCYHLQALGPMMPGCTLGQALQA